MTTKRLVLDSLILGLVYSFVITLIDISVLFLVYQNLSQVSTSLSLVLLAEGGLGLIAGGFVGMNSPIIRRIEEDFFHIKSRKPEDKNEFERHARNLIVTGVILIIVALLISAI